MNLESIEKQEIEGFLSTEDANSEEILVNGYIFFDRYNIEGSYITFSQLPATNDFIKRKFNFKSGKYLFKLNRVSYKSIVNNETIECELSLQIDSLTFKDVNRTSYTYHSSYVSNLLYEENQISLLNIEIYKKIVNREDKKFYYYEIESNNALNDETVNNIFYILSFMTASLFFRICSIDKTGKVKYIRKYSNNKSLTIFGSGNLMYPIDFALTYKLVDSMVNKDFFRNIVFIYSKFTTIKDRTNQFLNGSNLLEYLATCYITNHKKEYSKLIKGQGSFSERLFFVLDSVLKNDEKGYLNLLFSGYPKNIFQLNNSKKVKQSNAFFFVRLRNNLVHNGKLVEDKNEFTNLLDNIFVINELLRMLISHLDKIEKVEKTIYGIQVNSMKQSIKDRKQLLGK